MIKLKLDHIRIKNQILKNQIGNNLYKLDNA